MLSDPLIERVLRWLSAQRGEAELLAARRAFEGETGAILEGALDYESRIAHFFEQYLCEDVSGPAPIARFAELTPNLSEAERAELAGWLRSHRTLLRFENWDESLEVGCVRDLVLGGNFRVGARPTDRQLAIGDHFDGRLVPLAGRLWLSPGRVFHPQAAHAALDGFFADGRFRNADTNAVLNGLLRMRARFFQFESIRAEHVYRLDALNEPTFAAPWASPSRRTT
jgi:hypothetical protein